MSPARVENIKRARSLAPLGSAVEKPPILHRAGRHNGLDPNRVGRLVDLTRHFHVLAVKLAGLGLVIQLVIGAACVQHELVAALHDAADEAVLRLRGRRTAVAGLLCARRLLRRRRLRVRIL